MKIYLWEKSVIKEKWQKVVAQVTAAPPHHLTGYLYHLFLAKHYGEKSWRSSRRNRVAEPLSAKPLSTH